MGLSLNANGLGSKFKTKPKAIMGYPQGSHLQLGVTLEGSLPPPATRWRGELRQRNEKGNRGGAMKRGAVVAVWWRPEGAAAVVAGAGARVDGAGGGGLATSRRCYRFGEREEWRATRVWKVVKPSRPPTNALLMKTGETMADMRRKMAEAACMFGPHARRKAALGILLLAIGFSRLSHLTILSSFLW